MVYLCVESQFLSGKRKYYSLMYYLGYLPEQVFVKNYRKIIINANFDFVLFHYHTAAKIYLAAGKKVIELNKSGS